MSLKKILMCLLIVIVNAYSKDSTPETLINNIFQLYNNHQSIKYSVAYKIKNLNSDDTISIMADCNLIKDKEDSILNKTIWYLTASGGEVICFKDKSYSIIHPQNLIYEMKNENHQKTATTGNINGEVINTYFFNPEQLLKNFQDKSNQTNIESVIFDNKKMWKIEFKLPDQRGMSEIQRNLWIDKGTYFIKKIDFHVKYQGTYQFKEWILKDMEFDSFTANDVRNRFDSLKKIYTIFDFDSISKKQSSMELIRSGNTAPSFSGYYYQKQKKINISKYDGKLILLDFWYTSCSPCVLAIPGINKLYNKYKNKGFVALGINSKDDYKNKMRLKKFLKFNKIDYPLLFVESTVDSSYKVNVYPTFYLIDKTGKIVYGQKGHTVNPKDYNKLNTDSLEYYIKKNLK